MKKQLLHHIVDMPIVGENLPLTPPNDELLRKTDMPLARRALKKICRCRAAIGISVMWHFKNSTKRIFWICRIMFPSRRKVSMLWSTDFDLTTYSKNFEQASKSDLQDPLRTSNKVYSSPFLTLTISPMLNFNFQGTCSDNFPKDYTNNFRMVSLD